MPFVHCRPAPLGDLVPRNDRRRKDIVQYPARPRLFLPEPDSQGDRKRTLLIQKSCCAEVFDKKMVREVLATLRPTFASTVVQYSVMATTAFGSLGIH